MGERGNDRCSPLFLFTLSCGIKRKKGVDLLCLWNLGKRVKGEVQEREMGERGNDQCSPLFLFTLSCGIKNKKGVDSLCLCILRERNKGAVDQWNTNVPIPSLT